MLRTTKLDMAELVKASAIDVFLSDLAWAICSIYHTVLKASPGAAIFGQDMLFNIPFIVYWKKIGEHRQRLTELTPPEKTKAGLIMITKLAREYLYGTMVSSAKQSPGIRKSHGQLRQFIRMEQSWFNAETS